MILPIENEPIPIRKDDDGVLRIGKTRVTLDAIVGAFKSGATVDEIAQQYPSVEPSDIYLVVGYFLRNQQEVEEYIAKRNQRKMVVKEENPIRYDSAGLRERLLKRTAKKNVQLPC